jgi:predicted small lipoprotein YifL
LRSAALIAALLATALTLSLLGGCGSKTPLEIPKKAPAPVKAAS